ncbi:MAG: hypothetical protein GX451_09210, partial [Acholeplasmataceae bacterium]|nr:hypothetical protein [Acholeplasmataceae bacterium]
MDSNLPEKYKTIWSAAFSGNGRWLACGCEAGTVCLYDIYARKTTISFQPHSGFITGLAIDYEGKRVFTSSSYDCSIKVWDAFTGSLISSFDEHDYIE